MQMAFDEESPVPLDNTEMVRLYGSYVAKLVGKYNRVLSNSEDLLQHTWAQLLHVDVLSKYQKSTGSQARQLTGEESAKYLQMTWGQFKVMVWRGFRGDQRPEVPGTVKARVFERDFGICTDPSHEVPFDAVSFRNELVKQKEEKPAGYKEVRRQLRSRFNISPKTMTFWDVEKISSEKGDDAYRTVCLFCLARKRAAKGHQIKRSTSSMILQPIKGTWASMKSLYDVIDVEKFKILRELSSHTKVHGEIEFQMPQTRSRFKLYLAKAVHNIYANWCRTRSRKYKELYFAPTEEGQAWESFLEDGRCNDPEAKMIVTEEVNNNVDRVIEKLSRKVKSGELCREDIVSRLREGHTIAEILRDMNLPRAALQVVVGRFG